jgi:hypothetical protein
MGNEVIYTALDGETIFDITRLASGKWLFSIAGPYETESIDLSETQLRALRHVLKAEIPCEH